MNLEKLKNAETHFFSLYPEGFRDPEMQVIAKKHKVAKMTSEVQSAFAKPKFDSPEQIILDMGKLVGKSSVVSVFEKPKFRDYTKSISDIEKKALANALFQQLHGNQQKGFVSMVELLTPYKLAKWTLVTVIPAYYYPSKEIFIKPTTAKNILNSLEISDPIYKATPTFEFYTKYRQIISDLKKHINPNLHPNNLAFSGFLMMSLQ